VVSDMCMHMCMCMCMHMHIVMCGRAPRGPTCCIVCCVFLCIEMLTLLYNPVTQYLPSLQCCTPVSGTL
jgi:hypothetical protein